MTKKEYREYMNSLVAQGKDWYHSSKYDVPDTTLRAMTKTLNEENELREGGY